MATAHTQTTPASGLTEGPTLVSDDQRTYLFNRAS
jgi:hypothetical protein